MAETKERKPSIELLHYQKARMSMSEQERIHFVLKENGNCEGFLELKTNSGFCKRFFLLDVSERKFSYYTDNPKVRTFYFIVIFLLIGWTLLLIVIYFWTIKTSINIIY